MPHRALEHSPGFIEVAPGVDHQLDPQAVPAPLRNRRMAGVLSPPWLLRLGADTVLARVANEPGRRIVIKRATRRIGSRPHRKDTKLADAIHNQSSARQNLLLRLLRLVGMRVGAGWTFWSFRLFRCRVSGPALERPHDVYATRLRSSCYCNRRIRHFGRRGLGLWLLTN